MTAPNPATAFALVLVDELARAGVTDAVLAPGSRSAPVALALHADARIRLHVEIDERSAAFLALGLGKASRRPAVVLTTSGTAAANLHPAVVEAHQARVPLLVLTADRPPELRGTAANQAIDQVKLYGSAVREFVEVGVPEDRPGAVAYWRSVAARACAAAAGSPRGPAHLNLALREPLLPSIEADPFRQPLDGRAGGRPWYDAPRPPRRPDPAEVAAVADLARGRERGLLVVGDTDLGDGGAGLLALAEVAGWPLIAEPLSGVRTGQRAVSTAHLLLSAPGFAAAHRPDLVVRVGRLGLSRALGALLDAGVPQVLVDADGAFLDPERAVSRVVAADPAPFCQAVAERLDGAAGTSGWLAEWLEAERRARGAVDAALDGDERATEPRTARDLAALAPDGATLVVASSMPVRDLDWTMRPRAGLRVLGNRGASGIDGFVSTALGVALAGPGPTLALAGDLSLLHDQNGFLLAGRDAVDLVVVVVNNDGGGIFSLLPHARLPGDGFEAVFGTPHGVDVAALAAVYGLGHERVERATDLAPAVEAAAAAGGVRLVEVRTDRAANAALHRRLGDEVAAALAGSEA